MLLRRFLLLSTVVSLAIGCVLFFWRLHQKNDVTLERPHSVVSMAKPLGKKMIQEVKPQLRRSATHNAAKTEGKVSSSRNPVLTLTKDGFLKLLQGLGNNAPSERVAAQRELLALSNPEKIHWLRMFSQDEDKDVRLSAMKAVKLCFGWETFGKKTGTTYAAMKKRRQAAAEQGHPEDPMAAIPVSFEGLPTKREAVQINDMVRTALSDESQAVRDEALQAAMSFDVETCNMIYQYAITSCDDQMRLAVLKNAEYGDDDFRLRLQMAALDVGGEEVVRVASEGIKKDTGMTFSSSQEAFDWYEKHRTEPDK